MRRLVLGAFLTAAALTGCTCSSPAPKAEAPAGASASEAQTAQPKGPLELANPEALPNVPLPPGIRGPRVEVDPETARWARERDAIAHALLQRGDVAEARTHFQMIIDRTPAGSTQHEAAKRALEQAPR